MQYYRFSFTLFLILKLFLQSCTIPAFLPLSILYWFCYLYFLIHLNFAQLFQYFYKCLVVLSNQKKVTFKSNDTPKLGR